MRRVTARHAAFLFGLAIAISACSILSPQPDPSRFYVLTADSAAAAPAPALAGANQLSLGLGPVTLPGYLDRPQVVTRVFANQLELSAENRWAEPLKSSFNRVLAQNLSTALGGQNVVPYPWYRSTPIDYQVKIDVERFEATGDAATQLVARWEIRDPSSGAVLESNATSLSEPITPSDKGAQAQSLSRALAAFSREIASAIGRISASRTATKSPS